MSSSLHLDGVLRARKSREKQCQGELARILLRLADMEAALQFLHQQVRVVTADVRDNHLTGKLDMNFLAEHRRYLVAMQAKAAQITQELSVARRNVEIARTALALAARDRKLIEKLLEKAEAGRLGELARKEMLQQDEQAMQLAHNANV